MTTASPTRIFPHLQAIYDEYGLVHASSGVAMAAVLNAVSRKIDADRAFLEAFQHLSVTTAPQPVTATQISDPAPAPAEPETPLQPPPLPPHWGGVSDSAADDVEEWRAELYRRRQEALKREGE